MSEAQKPTTDAYRQNWTAIWGTKKPRPPEGNPFPVSYRQHDLWERDHEPGGDTNDAATME